MSQTTYGSITIVDITDVGQLSVYPTSNMPLSIIYDPDQNIYTPNWSATNLSLTPVIYYNNQTLAPTATGVTVTWRRREGAGNISALTTGETVTNGILTVNANKFTPSSTMLSYIVTVAYVEPDTNNNLTAEGQITFSLVKLASTAKTCSINGGTIFKYNTNQTLVGDSSITLTATITGVSISAWQYKTADGTWATYPNSTATNTLIVRHDDNIFQNDVATIKVVTDDNAVYDIHSITKLRDGAAGSSTVTAVLTNEDQMIAFPNQGNPDFTHAVSQILIYKGGVVDTQNWTITQSASENLTITSSTTVKANDTVQVTGMTGDTGSVTFTCRRSGYADIMKMFSVVKVQQGADAENPVIYSIHCNAVAVNKTVGDSPSYNPSNVLVSAYRQEGNTTTAYSGRIKIMSGTTTIHNVNTDESSYTITSSNMAAAAVNGYMTVQLYQAGGTTTLLDTQTIVITSDGEQGAEGQQGPAGVDAINVILGNQADVIPCTSSNKPQRAFTIDIPFSGYKGTTQVACTVSNPSTICGITPTVTQSTASSIGHIIYNLTTSTDVSNPEGNVSFSFTCEGKTVVHTYRWTRSTAATNGVNAVLFEVYTTSGNVFTSRESQNITMYSRLMDGATDKTTNATNWVWAKWQDGAYTTISGATSSSLQVNNSTVDGYASYRVTCSYNSKTYTGYYVLLDKLDPIQAEIFSSIGNQIVNSQGVGALYVIVTDTGTGQELDELKSDRFLTTAPSNPTTGDFYYQLNTTNKTVTLKKYTGSAWTNASGTDLPSGSYTWTFRDKDGNATVPTGIATTGKVIYIDGSLINKKIIADVKVEI